MRFAGDVNPSAMLLNNPIHGGKPEARALAEIFRGEERFKDMAQRFGAHAHASVGDCNHSVAACGANSISSDILALALNGASFNAEPSTVWHGVVRVDRQVHQHLVELA